MTSTSLYGGIEAGGTKFICAVGDGPDRLLDECRIATAAPDQTLGQVVDFFQPHVDAGRLRTIGIGSFGPVDTDPASPTFGYITNTPKPGWQNCDILGRVKKALNVEVGFDSDVNAAALAEYRWGASRGLDPSLYLTIGTGIGGGYIKDGRPLSGLSNTEMGHIRLPRDPERDPFPGSCPFHGDCFEGLASGPAIRSRFEEAGEALPDEDPYWELEAEYIAQALVNYILVLSPRRIVIGGGVMQRSFLFPLVRKHVLEDLAGYVQHPGLLEGIDEYIVPPALGGRAGVLGALALASAAQDPSRAAR